MIDYLFTIIFSVLGFMSWFSPITMSFFWFSIAFYSAYSPAVFVQNILYLINFLTQ